MCGGAFRSGSATLTIAAPVCYTVKLQTNRRPFIPRMDLDVEAIKTQIAALKNEHRDLDGAIARVSDHGPAYNPVDLQRLKKRKLALKDLIAKLESQLLPDIIA
jgi:hypothetical protein